MSVVFFSLGTNMGDRRALLRTALERLAALGPLTVSPVYATAPVGLTNQPEFWNVAARLETDLVPEDVLARTAAIEQELGRVRTIRWGPRTMDIDILLYDDRVIDTPALTIPHPRLHERAFVLAPLLALWPDARLPAAAPAGDVDLRRALRQLEADQSVRRLHSNILEETDGQSED